MQRHGAQPSIIWLRCGNTSNLALRILFEREWERILALLDSGEFLIEITDRV
ncbi:MAG: DUF5615 family PIN-like protein [Gemmatimonadota bacterium]